MAKITLKNIFSFFEGNLKLYLDQWDALPEHEKEQVAYRLEICKDDCVKQGKCVYCGCKVPGKLYSRWSCNNNERFPGIMTPQKWEEYKKENNIEIEIFGNKKG
jgi:hypothetical protein